ncbi:hypothetical protein LTR96_008414 [Exophiala xenobiotica]|nr:hypothetical protein LTR96_008414 [Exophiala xenobiotica]KAK5335629.1 hypothetical protein LTR98_008629 [Exophiala xenobiotica]
MHYFQSVHLYQTSPSYAPQHLHTQVATYAIDNPYHVNGKKIVDQKLKSLRDVKNVRLADKTFAMVVGEKPNYRGVRVGSVKKLENVIKKGGWIFKAQKIKNCLDAVFAKNVALLQPGEVEYTLNNPKPTDLVPGLLSMDYIYNIYERGGKQAAFDSRVGVVVGGDRFLENLQADSS